MSSIPTCRYHPDVSEGVRHCARCGMTYCSNCLVDINGLPHCSVCKSEQLLDIKSGVDRTTMPLAGIGKRFVALIIDWIVTGIPNWLMSAAWQLAFPMVTPAGRFNPTFFWIYIPTFALPLLYEALMLAYNDGQTVGKLAMKIRVVRPDGSSISKGQAWGRSALRLVLGCLIIVDYLPAFFNKDRTTLHDMAAGTRVVDSD